MPGYAFLADRDLGAGDMARDLTALYRVGVPYTKADIAKANEDIRAQADPNAGAGDLVKRYPKAQVRDFDGDPSRVTEMDALIAYLQMLGTLVDVEKAAPQEQAHAPDTAAGAAR
jgi:cytochrome c oxidase cbb3-type subunit 2